MFEVQSIVYNVCSRDVQALNHLKATGRKETFQVTYFLKHLNEMLNKVV